ncbi:MAG TPA: hypothetical protein VFQ59_00330 [Candidatus Paceibacterota bacterium]|nr:hypothetical protein [Candidatus Paceibacterota bacterium]
MNNQPQFTQKEKKLIKSLNTPAKIQDFLNKLPFNFEKDGHDTIKSPLRTLREKNAHCFEGALLGAYILSQHGHTPLLLHLKTTSDDMDHVIAPFKINGLWGALSKTNHAVLRYRDPVYKNIRELVMSYFHEYFLYNGKKTLRQYSKPLDMRVFKKGWEVSVEDLWIVDEALDRAKNFDIAPKNIIAKLRKADILERKVGQVEEYPKG